MGSRTGKPLIECPVCKTPVEHAVHIGLRDFSWVNDKLPGKIKGMDIDFCLAQSKTGRVLFVFLQAAGEPVSMGLKLAAAQFVTAGIDVWYVWETRSGRVKRGISGSDGTVQGLVREYTVDQLGNLVAGWWEEGL